MIKPAKPFARFLVVGCLGFVVDAGALWCLMSLGGDAYIMRGVSFLLAISVTWLLNRRWTFQSTRRRAIHREYASYALVQGGGTALNFVVYAWVLSLMDTSPATAVIALACGSLVALVANYLGMKHMVFRAHAPQH